MLQNNSYFQRYNDIHKIILMHLVYRRNLSRKTLILSKVSSKLSLSTILLKIFIVYRESRYIFSKNRAFTVDTFLSYRFTPCSRAKSSVTPSKSHQVVLMDASNLTRVIPSTLYQTLYLNNLISRFFFYFLPIKYDVTFPNLEKSHPQSPFNDLPNPI